MMRELAIAGAILIVMFVLAGCSEQEQGPRGNMQGMPQDGNFGAGMQGDMNAQREFGGTPPEGAGIRPMGGMPSEMLEELGLEEGASMEEITEAMRVKLGLEEGTAQEEIMQAWNDMYGPEEGFNQNQGS